MKVTEHFSSEEFGQPARHGFLAKPYPERWIEKRLRPLCELLEVIRKHVDAPLIVTSGYRSRKYNRRIGSTDASQHVWGNAADIQTPAMAAKDLHALILALDEWEDLPRLGGLGRYPDFVHIDIRPRKPGGGLYRWGGSRGA